MNAKQATRAYVNSGLLRQDLEKANVLPEVIDLIVQTVQENLMKGR